MQMNNIRHFVFKKGLQFLVDGIRGAPHFRSILHLRQHDIVQFKVVAIHAIVDQGRETVDIVHFNGENLVLKIKRIQTE